MPAPEPTPTPTRPSADDTRPQGPPTKVYIPYQWGMERGKPYVHTIHYNGWSYTIRFGQENTLPKEVAEYIRDLGSQPTRVPDLKKYDPDYGGTPRPQEQFESPAMREEYIDGRFEVKFV